jgi:DNA-binding NarL/FixJ family response regulator
MTPYRIVLADDHVILREGIKRMIDETKGLEVIGEAGDGLELLRLLTHEVPDMVILDISMPRLRGIEAAGEIGKRYPRVDILILSMHKKQEYLYLALQAGAKGYLLKEDTGTELIAAIQTIRNGRTYLSPLIRKDLPADLIGIIKGNHGYANDPLTSRERQVLKLVVDGKTSREIAADLCVSIHTIHNHRKNIRHKLKITCNADLIKYALEKGYAPEPA